MLRRYLARRKMRWAVRLSWCSVTPRMLGVALVLYLLLNIVIALIAVEGSPFYLGAIGG